MNRMGTWMAAAVVAAAAGLVQGTGTREAVAGSPQRVEQAAPVTAASLAPVASTVTVTLNGPTSVRPSVQCYWWALAAGGTPPYSYTWSGGLGGFSWNYEYFTTSPGSGSFTVSVTVTDALGATASASTPVAVNSRAPICPM